jgi:hypothetical protein
LGFSIGYNKKIAIGLMDQSQLYCEIEQWDTVNDKICIWVSRSDWIISSTEDTVFYLYYDGAKPDNLDYVGTLGNRTEVWGTDTLIRLGLHTDSTDSTNGHNGNETDVLHVASQLAYGASCNGSTSKIDISNPSGFQSRSTAALKFWFKTSVPSIVLSLADTATAGEFCQMALGPHASAISNESISLAIEDGTYVYVAEGDAAYTDGNWHHCVVNFFSDGWEIWIDSISKTIATYGGPQYGFTSYLPTVNSFILGGRKINYRGTVVEASGNGILDEFCIYNSTLSEGWITADYHAQTNSLLTLGTLEEMPTYIFSGTVRVLGTTSSGIELVLFHHPSNDLIGTDFSDSDGSFSISSTYDGTHYLVAFPPAGTNYNAEIIYDIQST